MKPKVSIIILNWNGWKDTIECLESVYQIKYPNYEVILVDNKSSGPDLEKIKEWGAGNINIYSNLIKYNEKNKPIEIFEYSRIDAYKKATIERKNKFDVLPSNKKLYILKNEKNYLFAKGNNIAIKQVLKENKSDYVLLLNNDTVVSKDFLNEMVSTAEKEENIGLVGVKMYYYNSPKKIWFSGGFIDWNIYPGYHHFIENKIVKKCDWITGACMLINERKLKTILDEKYEFGCEDIELSIRVLKNNLKIKMAKNGKVWHKIGQSRGISIKSIKKAINTNNLFLKNNNKSYSLAMLFNGLLFYSIRMIRSFK